MPIWVSVGGFSAADYAELCEQLDERDEVETIELNLSCPNVEEAPETAAELVAAARAATTKPLYAKLSPATWDVAESARAVAHAGADGLSLVNTIRGLAHRPEDASTEAARGPGGYSGPGAEADRTRVRLRVRRSGRPADRGHGRGLLRESMLLDFVSAGASAVALGTVLFVDPWAPARIRSELESEGVGPVAERKAVGRRSASSPTS